MLGVSAAVCVILLNCNAFAFDTGHHFDLTRDALLEAGFGDEAIKSAQIVNWLTDYYSEQPFVKLRDQLKHLHFDNLGDYDAVARYWGRLTANTRTAIAQAAIEGKTLEVIGLLGISLHAVQDFYSHSNWAETFPKNAGDAFRSETWFSTLTSAPIVGLRTGIYPSDPAKPESSHGDYDSGLNHDSYGRPNWQES